MLIMLLLFHAKPPCFLLPSEYTLVLGHLNDDSSSLRSWWRFADSGDRGFFEYGAALINVNESADQAKCCASRAARWQYLWRCRKLGALRRHQRLMTLGPAGWRLMMTARGERLRQFK
jgi:hypothetical protein